MAPEAPPGALARLGRLLPGVDALVRFAYRTAGVSAAAAALVGVALWDLAGATPQLAAVVAGICALPAAALALAGWTLADVASIPSQIRQAALAAAGREAAVEKAPRSRLVRLGKRVWAARGLALLTQGGWLKAVGALRFVRLASLPFALGLLAFVSLNAVVITGGAVSLLLLLLF